MADFCASSLPSWTGDWPALAQDAARYCQQMRLKSDPFAYRVSEAATEPTAIASATAALLAGFIRPWPLEVPADHAAWAAYLTRFFADDGLLDDPIDFSEPTQKQPHWALRAHRTRHVLWAIETLGITPPAALAWLDPLLQHTGGIVGWLDAQWPSFLEAGFWPAGNWLMDVGVLLDARARHHGDPAAEAALQELLKALAARLDPATGFWWGTHDTAREAMAGAMHLYPLYWAWQVELPYFDKAIDATLALQQPDGLFDYRSGTGGSQCLDYDAMLILCNGLSTHPQKAGYLQSAATRLLQGIGVNRLASGAWSDSRQPVPRHWATRACAFHADGGSLWDTYARLLAVGMALHMLDRTPTMARPERHLFEIWSAGRGWHRGRPPQPVREPLTGASL